MHRKRAIGFTFITLIVFSLIQILSPGLQAQSRIWNRGNQPRDGACLYSDENYKGKEFCVTANESQRKMEERYNNRISSVRTFGKAEMTVNENENFNGSRQTFSQNVPKLREWNDRITSFQVTGDPQYGGREGGQSREQYGSRSRGNETRDRACLYNDRDYKGEELCVEANESQRKIGERHNDRISSIRIFGRAQGMAYENDNFGGTRRIYTSDMPNLGDINDKSTSIEVTGGNGCACNPGSCTAVSSALYSDRWATSVSFHFN